MTFKLEQILSDPELRAPKGVFRVDCQTLFQRDINALVQRLPQLNIKLNKAGCRCTYLGGGQFEIHNP